MKKVSLKGLWEVLKEAGNGFLRNKVPKLSASLAYSTVFSLGPMLIVIIFLTNLFWSEAAIEGRLFGQIRTLVGDNAALQIQDMIKNVAINGNNKLNAIIGFVTLIIGATGVFTEIQDSVNTIWTLAPKPERGGFLMMLKSRLLSFSLVISLGFLLLVSMVINSLIEGFMDKLQHIFPGVTVVLVYIVNIILTLVITSFLFSIIFKVLPDALIRWKDVAAGAVFTALLFMLGKFAITFYITKSNPGNAYGAAGSLVVLLVWVYYTSLILYFGAEFTKAYAVKYGAAIRPNNYAMIVETVKVESAGKTLQENDEKREETEEHLQKAKDQLNRKS